MDADAKLPAVDLVTATLVTRADVGRLAGVTCGDTPAGRDAADWINDVGWPSVSNELRRGTKVWAYANRDGKLVGFGSMRLDWWVLAAAKRRVAVHYMPMLAIFAEHQGRPEPSSGSPKYCRQLLEHLLDQAVADRDNSSLVGLSVRPDNAKAISLYRQAGFEFVDRGRVSRMLLRLA